MEKWTDRIIIVARAGIIVQAGCWLINEAREILCIKRCTFDVVDEIFGCRRFNIGAVR